MIYTFLITFGAVYVDADVRTQGFLYELQSNNGMKCKCWKNISNAYVFLNQYDF